MLFRSSITLLRDGDQSCIDDLAAAGLKALGAEIGLEHLKELFDDFSLAKSLSDEGDGGGIWDTVHDTKTNKLLEGTPVIDLEFKLFIAEVEELLENQHLEEDQWIDSLSACIALSFVLIAPFK